MAAVNDQSARGWNAQCVGGALGVRLYSSRKPIERNCAECAIALARVILNDNSDRSAFVEECGTGYPRETRRNIGLESIRRSDALK